MAEKSKTTDGLPTSIGKPATRALEGVGITLLSQVASWTEADLKQLHGVGPKALRVLRDELRAIHLDFVSQ